LAIIIALYIHVLVMCSCSTKGQVSLAI